jgi:glycosyltransferase involved in cell wall biosynthesis
VSQATVDDLVRLGIAPRDSFRVVHLGLDLDRFARVTDADGVEFRARAGAAADDILLTCVCRLVPHKRVDRPIRAVASLRGTNPDLRLAVVGDGEHRPALERLARELGVSDRVTFMGYMPDVAPVAAAADIAVLTSDSDEGTPVSLIEAAAAGVPAIATTIGGVADVVAPGAGVLLAPGDEAGLADGIARLAADADLRRRMGRTASAHVLERFAVERLLDDMDSLYGELLSRGPA